MPGSAARRRARQRAHEARRPTITIVAHMAPALVEPDAWAQHGGPLTGMLVAALDGRAQPASRLRLHVSAALATLL